MVVLNPVDEKALLLRLQKGDTIAFGELYLKHHAPLCHFAGKLLGNGEGGDIVDDVFLKLWEKNKHFNELEHLKAFLYHTIRNACLDRIRSNKRRKERNKVYSADCMLQEESYLAEITRTEVFTELYTAVSNLPAQAGKIIRKTYLEGKSNEEVAAEMQLSVQTVKNQKRRALQLLRGKLSPESYKILLALAGLS